jgi:hypothetical protein
MKCQGLRKLIPDYLAGELPQEVLREFEAHLMQCDDCRAELEQMELTWVALGDLPEEEPAPELRGRFYAMLEDEKQRIARAERGPWLRRLDRWLDSWMPKRPAVQVTMAALFLMVGLVAGMRLETGQPSDGEVAQLRGEIQQMQEMVSMSLLNQTSSSERLRGVNLSAKVSEPSEALLTSLTNTLESDPNINVRLAAVDALAFFRDEPTVVAAATRALARETSPTVQIALIDLLIVIREKKALDALRRFVDGNNIDPSVKEHAKNRISDSV